jgi:hypothetical protein
MVSLLAVCLDVNKKAAGSYLPPLVSSHTTGLSGRRLADRRLVFPARAADVPGLLCRDLAARLAVQGKGICLVHLDFVVCP